MTEHLIAAVLVLVGLSFAAPAQADPNDPNVHEGGQAEPAYIADVHRADPHETRSPAQLLADGLRACDYRRAGHENIDLPGITPAEAAWALTDLCPDVGDC